MAENKWNKETAPPPPLFLNQAERDLVKQLNDELIEKVVGQIIAYYPIDTNNTEYHPLYGEAIHKTFLPVIKVHALIEWHGKDLTTTGEGIDYVPKITIHFHKRRLTEDQDLFVQEGDFVLYGSDYYELTKVVEPDELWGRTEHKIQVSAEAVKARKGLFNGV